ncbi:WhiB family transcriptional regulator [Cellulomonas shaoxiangyii]|uniref:Transcriptional regulator WhiB n=1 Tax=Cellulomonas shaoxiangyii TaxID=2566013 RepID=A0A4P7SH28_9CELL|nr:WhiB family transcriptional regulator [Cellulomonas shaoxiangyii]QCB93322.1 WhiB family transcriptional regulator [Cellulomonas shaoxiangyii]TGY79427.1 WhiB family transcriptional regulator [Cellulomonas shaoxiangyii]
MTIDLPTIPAWVDSAACASVGGDYWYPEKGDRASADYARKVCGTCPLIATCLEYALDNNEPHGIWGGLTPKQRQRLGGAPVSDMDESDDELDAPAPRGHGTVGAYNMHRRRGENACHWCKQAQAAYSREYRARKAGAA